MLKTFSSSSSSLNHRYSSRSIVLVGENKRHSRPRSRPRRRSILLVHAKKKSGFAAELMKKKEEDDDDDDGPSTSTSKTNENERNERKSVGRHTHTEHLDRDHDTDPVCAIYLAARRTEVRSDPVAARCVSCCSLAVGLRRAGRVPAVERARRCTHREKRAATLWGPSYRRAGRRSTQGKTCGNAMGA